MSTPGLRAIDPLSLVAAVVCGIVLGVGIGWVFHGGSPTQSTTPSEAQHRQPPARSPRAPDPGYVRKVLGGALSAATRRANEYGRMNAAVMVSGASTPIVRGETPSKLTRPRSMVEIVTALTLLQRTGAGRDDVDQYLRAALPHSDECAQRKLTIELQKALGQEKTREAMATTLRRAHGELHVNDAVIDTDGAEGPDGCASPPYPAGEGLSPTDVAPNPSGVLQLGTTLWRVSDAVRFMYALRRSVTDGPYQSSAAARILTLMRKPKGPSIVAKDGAEVTADPSWGAGKIFPGTCWKVAYNAGGGSSDGPDSLAGQMGTVELGNNHWVAFAVMFSPSTQPSNDDPGQGHADEMIEQALKTLRKSLRTKLHACP